MEEVAHVRLHHGGAPFLLAGTAFNSAFLLVSLTFLSFILSVEVKNDSETDFWVSLVLFTLRFLLSLSLSLADHVS